MQNEVGPIENVESQLGEVEDGSPSSISFAALQQVVADSTDTSQFDPAYKTRVMEDLDALLANLQSTTANISSYQKNQKHQQPLPQQHSYQTSQTTHVNNNNNSSSQFNDYDSSKPAQGHQQFSSVNNPVGSIDQFGIQTHSSSAQIYPAPYPVSRESYHSSGSNSGSSTPPPLPPPPADILDYSADFEHPIYEQQTFQIRETTPSSVSDSSDQAVAQGQPGRDRGQRMSALSSNLSELDQLLLDLNSAQFMAEVDRKSSNASETTVLNGSIGRQPPAVAPKPSSKPAQRTSVDNLLDQLEGTGSQTGRFPVDPTYQELSAVTSSHAQHQNGVTDPVFRATSTSSNSSSSSYNQPQTACTATKELDELMMSLSEFRNKGDATSFNEPAYAKPVKSRTASSSSPTSPHGPESAYHQVAGQRQVHQVQRENGLEITPGDHLEAMLGDLQSDLSRQGVSVKQKGICAACQKPIVGQVIAALGRTWHVEHFVCAHCEEPLGTRNFYERDSLAYCEKDYHQLFAPRCAYCNGPIVDKCITALEKMWHPEHFFCAQCGRPFGDDDFHEKNGKAYCREDYFQMFAPKCGGCAQPIMDNYISALNRQWHPNCFVCWDCRSPFGAGSFFDYEGLPYCETHYHAKKGSLCASCEKPITGRCITAMFRKFHPEHFVCAFCLKQLNKGTFKEQNDKPYCHPCFVKLFG